MPFFSIIVPVYNVEKYLNKCIESILNQTFKDFEIILIDDGSTDKSGLMCDEFALQNENIYSIHQENSGPGGARNKGIDLSKGSYILFLDSDDTLVKDALASLKTVVEHSKADLVLFDIIHINEKGEKLKQEVWNLKSGCVFSPIEQPQLLLGNAGVCGKLWRKELFDDLRFIPDMWYEDINLNQKLYTKTQRAIYLPEILYNYLIHDNSIMHNVNVARNYDIIKSFEDILDYFKKKNLYFVFYDELEYLVLRHVLCAATLRVIQIDSKSQLIDELFLFTKNNFKEFKKNKYIKTLNLRERIAFSLLSIKFNSIIIALYKLNIKK